MWPKNKKKEKAITYPQRILVIMGHTDGGFSVSPVSGVKGNEEFLSILKEMKNMSPGGNVSYKPIGILYEIITDQTGVQDSSVDLKISEKEIQC